ncbi:hypothetical protein HK098_003902 [Nowakowskiella sp. JEL0407]|nr:hypothetical protein HK098_003902 [Nowakowskiella sp. JEL0407]
MANETRIPFEIILEICESLNPILKFKILTLLRAEAVRAPLLCSIPQLSLKVAALSGNIRLLSNWKTYYREEMELWSMITPIDFACSAGRVEVLQWWSETDLNFIYTSNAFVTASVNGHLNVLNWFLENRKPLQLTPAALCAASVAEQLEVLEWWLERNIANPLNGISGAQKFEVLKSATISGNVALLEIWRRLGLRIKNSINHAEQVASAARNGFIEVVRWWLDFRAGGMTSYEFGEIAVAASLSGQLSILELLPRIAVESACVKRIFNNPQEIYQVEIFEWWANQYGFDNHWRSTNFIDVASAYNRVDLLDWAVELTQKNRYIKLFWTNKAMDYASANGHIGTLNWWIRSNLRLIWSEYAMDSASAKGHTNILDWWLDSKLDLRYCIAAMDNASWTGQVDSLDWWLRSRLPLKYSANAIEGAFKKNDVKVLQWWMDSGLEMRFNRNLVQRHFLEKHDLNAAPYEWWLANELEEEPS